MMAYAASNESSLWLPSKIRQKRPVFIVANLLYANGIKSGLSVFIPILKHVIEPIRLNLISLRASFLDDRVRLL